MKNLIQFFGCLGSVVFYLSPAYSQITFNTNSYKCDEILKLVVCNDIPNSIPTGTTTLVLDKTYTLTAPINAISKGIKYIATSSGQTYNIYFTNLPIINVGVSDINSINSSNEINGTLAINENNNNFYSSFIGIKVRGATSSGYDKKSYRVQLKNSSNDDDYKDESLFGLREDKRWLLLAMYNERLRLNNKISHDLWIKMHKLYYQAQEPEAISSIRSLYIELFINNSYRGVYLFTENTDRKQLKLKKTASNGTVRGELYKAFAWGNTKFEELPPIPPLPSETWGGWELKHPDEEEMDWQNLYEFTDFVKNSSNLNFVNNIASKVVMGNMSDYLIFLNLVRAYDNQGKNTFFCKYNTNEPYFYGVWDLDGTWGYLANGNRATTTSSLLQYHIYNRLINLNPNQFKHKTASRWFELRDGVLNLDSLLNMVDTQYNYLNENKVYNREAMKWNTVKYSSSELQYIKTWITGRVAYLDGYFQAWVDGCAAPTLNSTSNLITNGEQIIITASGCNGIVKWHNNPTDPLFIAKGLSLLTPSLYGTNTFYASCNIGTCISSTRSSITIHPDCSENNLVYSSGHLQPPAIYKTQQKITSAATLTGNTTYNSNKSILLLPGFKVPLNNVFIAEIKNCN